MYKKNERLSHLLWLICIVCIIATSMLIVLVDFEIFFLLIVSSNVVICIFFTIFFIYSVNFYFRLKYKRSLKRVFTLRKENVSQTTIILQNKKRNKNTKQNKTKTQTKTKPKQTKGNKKIRYL